MLPSGDFVPVWWSWQDTNGTTSSFMRRYFFPVSVILAPGRGSQNPPTVQTTQPDGLDGNPAFTPYGASGYGANVGAGDINDDGIDEALTGPGPSPRYGPHVRGFEPDGTAIAKVSFYAYGTLKFGVRPAGGNVDTDAYAEILTAPGAGGVFGPHIRGWDFDGGPLKSIAKVNFFAYLTLRFGARVSSGDIDGDGTRELLTAPGPGVMFSPQIRGWNYDGLLLAAIGKVNFNAFQTGRFGATVGASDVESDGIGGYMDGFQEIVVGRGPDPSVGADVRLFDYDATTVSQKYEIQPYTTMYGANVAGGDIDAGDTEEVVTAPGPDPAALAEIKCWEWDPVIGRNPDGARLQVLGPDQFTWRSDYYGANVAVGTFE
jgi:hypothetical protein